MWRWSGIDCLRVMGPAGHLRHTTHSTNLKRLFHSAVLLGVVFAVTQEKKRANASLYLLMNGFVFNEVCLMEWLSCEFDWG